MADGKRMRLCRLVRSTPRQAGFAVSTELLLIALILTLGLVTGWLKIRDQSLAEVADSLAAIDAYILGSGPLWQTGGTRWISNGDTGPGQPCQAAGVSPCIIGPSSTGAVTESWGAGGTAWPTAVETSPGVFEKKDGILLYGTTGAEAP